MTRRVVRSPDGWKWVVRRRWARRPRWCRPDPGKRAELPAGRFPPDEYTAGFARTDGPPPDERGWPVRGLGASRRAVDEVAELLAAGVDPGRIAERLRPDGEA